MRIDNDVFTIRKQIFTNNILRGTFEKQVLISIRNFPVSYRVKECSLTRCFSGNFILFNKRIEVEACIIHYNSIYIQSVTCGDLFSDLTFTVFNKTCCIVDSLFSFFSIFCFIRFGIRYCVGCFFLKNLFPCTFYSIEIN